jgi:hypothetical protein
MLNGTNSTLSIGGIVPHESIELEINMIGTETASLNDINIRTLATHYSGQISMSDFWYKEPIIYYKSFIGALQRTGGNGTIYHTTDGISGLIVSNFNGYQQDGILYDSSTNTFTGSCQDYATGSFNLVGSGNSITGDINGVSMGAIYYNGSSFSGVINFQGVTSAILTGSGNTIVGSANYIGTLTLYDGPLVVPRRCFVGTIYDPDASWYSLKGINQPILIIDQSGYNTGIRYRKDTNIFEYTNTTQMISLSMNYLYVIFINGNNFDFYEYLPYGEVDSCGQPTWIMSFRGTITYNGYFFSGTATFEHASFVGSNFSIIASGYAQVGSISLYAG